MKVVIKNVTGLKDNEWALWELNRSGVPEGSVVEGIYNPKNKSVSFSCGCNDCIAWLGSTCEMVEPMGGTITLQDFVAKIETGEAKVLTLEAAKKLKGKRIAWFYMGYQGNKNTVGEMIVGDVVGYFDFYKTQPCGEFASMADYWLSYMDSEKIENLKNDLVLLDGNGNNTYVYCHHHSYPALFKEPTFTCSDVDREVYYLELE